LCITFAFTGLLLFVLAILVFLRPINTPLFDRRAKALLPLALAVVFFFAAGATARSGRIIHSPSELNASSAAGAATDIDNQAKIFIKTLDTLTSDCDTYGGAIARVGDGPGLRVLSSLSSRAEPACDLAAFNLEAMSQPRFISNKYSTTYKVAVQDLSRSYRDKAYAFNRLKEVADKGAQPRAVKTASDAFTVADTNEMAALGKIISVFIDSGVDRHIFEPQTSVVMDRSVSVGAP